MPTNRNHIAPTVPADAAQLAQLLQHLIGNALKFRGAQRPEVHVRAWRDDPTWHFTVSDNGIGIEAEYFERIFRLFQRLHTRREYPGTGMGLAIARSIVQSHGGRLWAERNAGPGASFHCALPTVTANEPPGRTRSRIRLDRIAARTASARSATSGCDADWRTRAIGGKSMLATQCGSDLSPKPFRQRRLRKRDVAQ